MITFILLLILSGILTLIMLKKPSFFVYFWAVFSPFSVILGRIEIIPGVEQSMYGSMNLILLPIVVFIAIIHYPKIREGIRFLLPFATVIPIVLVSAVVAGSIDMQHFRVASGLLLFYLIGVFAYSFVNDKKSLMYLSILFFVPALVTCLSAIFDVLVLREYTRIYATTVRSASFMHINPNDLCLFSLIVLSVTVAARASIRDVFLKLIYLVVILIVLLTIFSTFSISGWGATIVFMMALVYLRYKKSKWLLLIFGAIIISVCVLIISQTEIYRFPQFYHIRTGGTWAVRSVIWQSTLRVFAGSPLIGYPTESGMLLYNAVGTTSAHNMLLGYLLSFGLLGTSCIIWCLWRIGQNLFRLTVQHDELLNKYGRSLVAVMIGILVYGVAHSVGFSPHHFMIFWIMSLSTIGYARQEELNQELGCSNTGS